MENKKPLNKNLKIALIAAIILIVLSFFLGRCNRGGNTDPVLFPTETTYVFKDRYIYDTLKEGKFKPVLPQITVYRDRYIYDTLWGIQVGDTIFRKDTVFKVVDNTNKIIGQYNKNFLTFKPKNPKLIQGKFQAKQAELTLVKPDGKLQTMTYPMDLSKYYYVWENYEMKAVALKQPLSIRLKLKAEGSFGVTYSPFSQSTRVDAQGTIWIRNLGLTSYSEFNVGQKPLIDTRVGVRVRF
jgi:hypothetical protein